MKDIIESDMTDAQIEATYAAIDEIVNKLKAKKSRESTKELTEEDFLKTIIKGANMNHPVCGLLGGIVIDQGRFGNDIEEIIIRFKTRNINIDNVNVIMTEEYFNSFEGFPALFKSLRVTGVNNLDADCYFYEEDSIFFGNFNPDMSDGFKAPEQKIEFNGNEVNIVTEFISVNEVIRPEGLAIIKSRG